MSSEARPELIAALGHCLAQLEAGASLDAILAQQPGQAAALRPLLEAALALRQLPLGSAPEGLAEQIGAAIVHEAREASEAGSRAVARQAKPVARSGRKAWRGFAALRQGLPARGLAIQLASLLVATGLLLAMGARASADSLPGGLLYPVKRGIERAQLVLASPSRDARLAEAFAERRLAEAELLRQAGRAPEPALAGLAELSPWASSLPEAAQAAMRTEASGGEAEMGRPDAQRGSQPPTLPSFVPRRGPTAALVIPASATRPVDAVATGLARATREARRLSLAATPTAMPPASVLASPLPPSRTPPPSATPPPTAEDEDDEEPPTPTDVPAVPTPAPAEPEPTPKPTRDPDPGWNRVEGKVMGDSDAALEAAQVTFVDALSGQRIAAADTDARGTFVLRLARGRYQVVATAEGYQNQWFRGQRSRDEANPVGLTGDGSTVTIKFRLLPESPLSAEATPSRRPRPGLSPTAASRPTRTPAP